MYQKKKGLNRLTTIILTILVLGVFTSCSLVNPDSYGKKNENTFVSFDPSSLDTLYVSKYAPDLGEPSLNGVEYDVIWEKDSVKGNTLKIISYYHPIHELYFTGLNDNERDDWDRNGDTISISEIRMDPMENGYYRLMLYEDLTR